MNLLASGSPSFADEQIRQRMNADVEDFALERRGAGPGVPVEFSRSDGKAYMSMERNDAYAYALRAYLLSQDVPVLTTQAEYDGWLARMREKHGFT